MEIERGAHTDQQRNLKAIDHLSHESLLLGRAQADPENVRSCFAHLIYEIFLFIGADCPERRRECSNHLQARESTLKNIVQSHRNSRLSAIEKNPIAFFGQTESGNTASESGSDDNEIEIELRIACRHAAPVGATAGVRICHGLNRRRSVSPEVEN